MTSTDKGTDGNVTTGNLAGDDAEPKGADGKSAEGRGESTPMVSDSAAHIANTDKDPSADSRNAGTGLDTTGEYAERMADENSGDDDDKAYIAALLRERSSLLRNPNEKDRLSEIDAELERSGYKGDKELRAAKPQGRQAPQRETATPGTSKAPGKTPVK